MFPTAALYCLRYFLLKAATYLLVMDWILIVFAGGLWSGTKTVNGVVWQRRADLVTLLWSTGSLLSELNTLEFFTGVVTPEMVFPTVHDAVLQCRHSNSHPSAAPANETTWRVTQDKSQQQCPDWDGRFGRSRREAINLSPLMFQHHSRDELNSHSYWIECLYPGGQPSWLKGALSSRTQSSFIRNSGSSFLLTFLRPYSAAPSLGLFRVALFCLFWFSLLCWEK